MYLNGILQGKKLIKLFNESQKIYRESVRELKKSYNSYTFSDEITYSFNENKLLETFKKNFFSILMTSIFVESGIDRRRCIDYTKLLTCLRQIVTSTDNIIDNEEKGQITIKGMASIVVKNNLISIASQNIMNEVLKDLGDEGSGGKSIVEKFYNIARGESMRDEALYKEYPGKEFIREEIHQGIGGELLELSLVVPKLLETNKRLVDYSRGLYKVGMALQALDDFCDMNEDLEDNKVNLGVGILIGELKYSREDLMASGFFTKSDGDDIKTFMKEYLKEVTIEASEGFRVLGEAGYPIVEGDIRYLLKYLFKIRGLEHLWDIVEV